MHTFVFHLQLGTCTFWQLGTCSPSEQFSSYVEESFCCISGRTSSPQSPKRNPPLFLIFPTHILPFCLTGTHTRNSSFSSRWASFQKQLLFCPVVISSRWWGSDPIAVPPARGRTTLSGLFPSQLLTFSLPT